jgi:hypothetical protein
VDLDTQIIQTEDLLSNYVFPLPPKLDEDNWQRFQKALGAIPTASLSPAVISILSEAEIAPDDNRTMKKARDLYSHDDSIFVSAFRCQKAKFLHASVQTHLQFWLKVGLRHRDRDRFAKIEDYLHFLQALQIRVSPQKPTYRCHVGL